MRSGGDAEIDGRQVSFREFTRTQDDQRTLCRWLWSVVLADGLRALTAAGRWQDALAHARDHHGIGQRLLDGRQVAILAHAVGGDTATAISLLHQSVTVEPWEHAVASCLVVLCRTHATYIPTPGR